MSRVQEIERPTARRAPWADLLRYELPLLACMAFITALSSRPSLPGPGERGSLLRDIFNYGSHMFIYGALAGLAWRVLVHRAGNLPGWLAARPRLSAILFALLYGIGDEIHQSFVPGRTASPWDALADLLGATLAMLAIGYGQGWLARRRDRAA
jgi:VanZ family protein